MCSYLPPPSTPLRVGQGRGSSGEEVRGKGGPRMGSQVATLSPMVLLRPLKPIGSKDNMLSSLRCLGFHLRNLRQRQDFFPPYLAQQHHKGLFQPKRRVLLSFSRSVVSDFCDPMDCSPPGSSVHGILQARVLKWVAISFSRGSSHPRDRTWASYAAGGLLHCRWILY